MAQESCAIILPQFIAVCVIALRLRAITYGEGRTTTDNPPICMSSGTVRSIINYRLAVKPSSLHTAAVPSNTLLAYVAAGLPGWVFCMSKRLNIIRLFAPSGSHTILVFPHQTLWHYTDGNPRSGVESRGYEIIAILLYLGNDTR